MAVENKNVLGREGLETQLIDKLSGGQLGHATDSLRLIHKSREVDGGLNPIITKYLGELEITNLISQAVGGNLFWLDPVGSVGLLPGADPLGAARFVQSEDLIYVNSSTGWKPVGEDSGTPASEYTFITIPPIGTSPTLRDLSAMAGLNGYTSNTDLDGLQAYSGFPNETDKFVVYLLAVDDAVTGANTQTISQVAYNTDTQEIWTRSGTNIIATQVYAWNDWVQNVSASLTVDPSEYVVLESRNDGSWTNPNPSFYHQDEFRVLPSEFRSPGGYIDLNVVGNWGQTSAWQAGDIVIPEDGLYLVTGVLPSISHGSNDSADDFDVQFSVDVEVNLQDGTFNNDFGGASIRHLVTYTGIGGTPTTKPAAYTITRYFQAGDNFVVKVGIEAIPSVHVDYNITGTGITSVALIAGNPKQGLTGPQGAVGPSGAGVLDPRVADLQATSGTWNDTTATVLANSASWGAGGVDPRVDVLSNTSATWNDTTSTLLANSGTWEDTTATVLANSASWASPTNYVTTDSSQVISAGVEKTWEASQTFGGGVSISGVGAGGESLKLVDDSWIMPQTPQGNLYLTNGINPSTENSTLHLTNGTARLTAGDGTNTFGDVRMGATNVEVQFSASDILSLADNEASIRLASSGAGISMDEDAFNWFDLHQNTIQTDVNGMQFTAQAGQYEFHNIDVSGTAISALGLDINNRLSLFEVGGGVGDAILSEDNIFTGTVNGFQDLSATQMEVIHTATQSDDYAFEIIANATGFGDVKAVDIDYITGAIATGDDEAVILINIDKSLSTGGDIVGLEVLTTTGLAKTTAILAGAEVGVVEQTSGQFGDMDSALVNATDRLAEFTSIGSNIQMFVNDNDTVTIGNAVMFEEIEFLLAITSSQNINPTFEYSTGVGTWATFTPIDGTNGLQNNGVIAWLDADIPTWDIGTGSEYLIRITRTRNGLATPPTESLVQIAETTEFFWDKDGNILVNKVTAGSGVNITGATSGGAGILMVDDSWIAPQTSGSSINITTGLTPTKAGNAVLELDGALKVELGYNENNYLRISDRFAFLGTSAEAGGNGPYLDLKGYGDQSIELKTSNSNGLFVSNLYSSYVAAGNIISLDDSGLAFVNGEGQYLFSNVPTSGTAVSAIGLDANQRLVGYEIGASNDPRVDDLSNTSGTWNDTTSTVLANSASWGSGGSPLTGTANVLSKFSGSTVVDSTVVEDSGKIYRTGGGNTRGTGATDLQISRSDVSQVASGQSSTIVGGQENTASGQAATIGGGFVNVASGDQSVVAGGRLNTASGFRTSIGGGNQNTVGGQYASIGGGDGNTATGDYSSIIGGTLNSDGGNDNVHILGSNITATAINTTYVESINIKGTLTDNVNSTGAGGEVLTKNGTGVEWMPASTSTDPRLDDLQATSGTWNDTTTTVSSNSASWAASGSPLSGTTNVLSKFSGSTVVDSTVVDDGSRLYRTGGDTRGTAAVDLQTARSSSTQVASGVSSSINGGQENTASGTLATIGGGFANVASGDQSVVAGGRLNTANGLRSTIAGGNENDASEQYASIGGGFVNVASGDQSVVAGGRLNTASGLDSTIGGGRLNTASGDKSVVAGGDANTVQGPYSTVGGGNQNVASGDHSTIAGGLSNTASGHVSFIGGGSSNIASGVTSTIAGGASNTTSGDQSTVAGGRLNVAGGLRSTIAGGDGNVATGNYSSIIGGESNSDGGFTNVHILGSNITATSAGATYVESISIKNELADNNGNTGNAGDMLTKTSTGLEWTSSILTKTLSIETPTSADTIPIMNLANNIIIDEIVYETIGATNVAFNIQHMSELGGTPTNVTASPLTATTTKGTNTTFSTATGTAGNYLVYQATGISGTPALVSITIKYRSA